MKNATPWERDAQRMDRAIRRSYRSLHGRAQAFSEADAALSPEARELGRILSFLGLSVPAFDREAQTPDALLELARAETGVGLRKVTLSGAWWKEGGTPLLCHDKEGQPVALLPAAWGGYRFVRQGRARKLTRARAADLSPEAWCFYRPLPARPLGIGQFLRFLARAFRPGDVAWLLVLSLLAGLLGMLMPAIDLFVFHHVVPSGTAAAIPGLCVLLAGAAAVTAVLELIRALWVLRLGNKLDLLGSNAIWARMLSLPSGFFREHESGSLAQRAAAIHDVCSILGRELIPTLLGCAFSLLYLIQIRMLAPELFGLAATSVLLLLGLYALLALLRARRSRAENERNRRLSGMVYQFLDGIGKIKTAGAERRAFARWAEVYDGATEQLDPGLIFSGCAEHALLFLFTILLYAAAFAKGLSASAFIAFNAAYSLFLGSVLSISRVNDQLAQLRPALEQLQPILSTAPEDPGGKVHVDRLSGEIRLEQVKFRYREDGPWVLDGLDVHIRPGEYVAVVGASGCGKSTLLRLLLGFERPQSGRVSYDGRDLADLDRRSVRRRIGSVLQNGKLFSGDIYSNIAVCAPGLTMDQAWQAAELSGLADDIRHMPMGMFTVLSEGGGGLSGGQRQRLLIARALASRPDVIFFDEATSALDNVTQNTVVKTLEGMSCTRLVIAHRLSTIRGCSRILYLDQGRVAEEGTFEALMALNGKFAALARRQLL